MVEIKDSFNTIKEIEILRETILSFVVDLNEPSDILFISLLQVAQVAVNHCSPTEKFISVLFDTARDECIQILHDNLSESKFH